MGQQTSGIYPDKDDTWQVDKWWRKTRLRQRGFLSFEEADRWLIRELEKLRMVVMHGARPDRTFSEAAAHYVLTHQDKVSLETEIHMLKSVMPTIGELLLPHVHDGSLAPYIAKRQADGRANKTINLALGVVRRILNLAATSWRDENGITWLQQAPHLTLLPLVGHQREPQPISWAQQRKLLPKLPDHLARMALFVLNTGVRDDVACSLRWEWEIKVPELGISIFEVPKEHVKGRRRSRVVVCNSVAQSIIDSVRGQHAECVFVYRRERVKNLSEAPVMPYRPIQTMNNTAWQNGRKSAKLGDLHVHDLRHTVGMRLREAGVAEGTISDLLWHSSKTMTQHYSVAQIVELHQALEKVKDDTGRWNKSLATLKKEQLEREQKATPPKVPQQKKTA
ncbi:tyrosine-type recombinase/integrase [Roseateles cavernae]|uniref:tyrosine-type recombinase/integrase n=1 Tax=Roseateles cavernae TaxID=3153578 RepID=UPI0032E426D1